MAVTLVLGAIILTTASTLLLDKPPPTPFSGCTLEGKRYNDGEDVPKDNCTICVCEKGHILCGPPQDCRIFLHECVDPVITECGCPKCPNGPNCLVGNKKIPAGIEYNDGSQICHCPESNHDPQHIGDRGDQAICILVGPIAPPSSTAHTGK